MIGAIRRLDAAIACVLALLVAAVFGQTATFGFVRVDDFVYVAGNKHVLQGLSLRGVRWALTAFDASNWHPLTWISHMLDVTLYGLEAGGHHLTSVLLHAANVVLLYAALLGLTGARWRSALVAAFFAVHPLRVESVAWIAERKDVLAAFFWLLTMLLYRRYVRRPGFGSYAATLAAFLCGLASKSVLVTLPFALLLLDWWPLGRIKAAGGAGLAGSATRLAVLEKLPFFVATLAASVATYRAQDAGGSVYLLPLAARLGNAAVSCTVYLRKTLWPADLAVFYPFREPWHVAATAAAAAFLLAVTAVVSSTARRRPWLTVGWLWFLGTLVPMSGLIQVGGQTMADRYTYLPLVGLFLAVTWSASDRASGSRVLRALVVTGAAAAIVALAVAAWHQTRLWSDNVRLFSHAIRVAPGNWLAHGSLAIVYAEGQEPRAAEEQFRLSLEANPLYFSAHANYALFLARQGRFAEARRHAEEALDLNPAAGTSFGLPALLRAIGGGREAAP